MKCPDCGRYTTLDPASEDCPTCAPSEVMVTQVQRDSLAASYISLLIQHWLRPSEDGWQDRAERIEKLLADYELLTAKQEAER